MFIFYFEALPSSRPSWVNESMFPGWSLKGSLPTATATDSAKSLL